MTSGKDAENKRHKHTVTHLGIVIITYGNQEVFNELLRRIGREKRLGDIVLVFDNHPRHKCAAIAEHSKVVDIVVRSTNIGFARGCNLAVESLPKSITHYLFLNPDALPEKAAIEKLISSTGHGWDASMGLVLLQDKTINSAGNVMHITGLSWCGNYSEPANSAQTQNVYFLSGACLMISRLAWERVGGFFDDYFMYYEDTDLSVNLHRAGLSIGIETTARFVHDYSFNKGSNKWFYLERNRLIFLYTQLPITLLLALLPAFVITEIGLWLVSIVQRRFLLRVRATTKFITMLPQLTTRRHQLKRIGVLTDRQWLELLQARIDTRQLFAPRILRVTSYIFVPYHKLLELIF